MFFFSLLKELSGRTFYARQEWFDIQPYLTLCVADSRGS